MERPPLCTGVAVGICGCELWKLTVAIEAKGRQHTTDSAEFGAEANNQVAEKIDSSEDVGFRDSGVGLSFSSRSLLSKLLYFWVLYSQ